MDSRRRAQWGLRTPSCQRDDKDIQPPALAWTEHAGKEQRCPGGKHGKASTGTTAGCGNPAIHQPRTDSGAAARTSRAAEQGSVCHRSTVHLNVTMKNGKRTLKNHTSNSAETHRVPRKKSGSVNTPTGTTNAAEAAHRPPG